MDDGAMLVVLGGAEIALRKNLLDDPNGWNTLDIDYEPPRVERLWREFGEGRLYLHRIYPCSKALYHPHPWPSAIRILSGTYEMGVGFGSGTQVPPKAATIILTQGSSYEMTHPDGWHYVRPLRGVSYSVMVTGPKWPVERWSPKPPPGTRVPGPIASESKPAILEAFRGFYKG